VRKALVISLLALAVLAGSGAVALHRYDASRSDLIAQGITVGGVEVGGLTEEQAVAAVRREVAARLERPLTLTYRDRRFRLDPALVDVRVDVDAAASAALAASREGSFLTRSLRDLTGGETHTDVKLDVTYSRSAVGRVVAGVRRELDRPARNAAAAASFAGVSITESQQGVAVRTRALRQAISQRLVSAEARRRITVPARTLKPKVTTKQVRDRFSRFIAVSRSRRELRLFVDGQLAKSYDVGIGALGFETPAGIYEIESKAANPAWWVPDKEWAGDLAGTVVAGNDPDNPIKARWRGFWKGSGIHGTGAEESIGTAASHGCIRMTVRAVIDLYDRVPLHTPISIA
jgi:lipoprotein-anchoring transpeptidase ErfK/SrfK